jgi:Zn-finger nucleic acid-binding protein
MSHGVFWACDKCSGRAVGLELLRRTFTPESINPLWLHAISGEGKIGSRCPSCGRPMIDVALSENTTVNVDVCRLCHFVWFDTHEVETLVPRPLPQTAPELPQKAREVLAVAKVQKLAEEARGTDFDSSPQTNSGSRSRHSVGCRSNSIPSSQSDVHGRRGRFA